MLRGDSFGMYPGLTTATETFEAAYTWGVRGQMLFTGGIINKNAVDASNSPTWELKKGLVLGQILADGSWTNYSPTNTDGSEVASGVLVVDLRMQDLSGVLQPKFYAIMVGGPVQAAKLLGLDLMARQQMDKFIFDDSPGGYPGNHWFPWKRFQTKTANYSLVAADNFSQFDNTGAVGEVDFTLPAIANGYSFGFRVIAAQILKVISNEGTNIVAFNNASATSLSFATGGSQIGGGLTLFSNPGATKWIAVDTSAAENTITVA